jgi:hypothetical protein
MNLVVHLQFEASVLIQVARNNLRPKIATNAPQPLQALIEQLWLPDPRKRYAVSLSLSLSLYLFFFFFPLFIRPTFAEIVGKLESIRELYVNNKSQWNKLLQPPKK